MLKPFIERLLFVLLGSKHLPYQHTHHAVLLVGSFGYLACSIFNLIFQTADALLAYAQALLFVLIIGIWYRSRFHNQYRRMALVFLFLMVLVALPLNWIYNAGLAGPTYFLNLATLAYISVAFRDFGVYRRIGVALTILIPLLLVSVDLYRPELIYQYPNNLVRAMDLSFSFVVTAGLLLLMMGSYSRRYRLERDKAEHLAEQLQALSEQDALTGLHNRRAMDRYIQRLQVQGRAFSLAILDLDHFKKLNDRWGHSYGDEVLCHFSKQLQQLALDSQGLAVRLGGEEFVLIMAHPEARALSALESLRTGLQAEPMSHGPVRFSAGLVMRASDESQDALLKRADLLLYQAKDQGRDRIRCETLSAESVN